MGKANLRWEELEEVIIDIENTLNNRPLCYLEDDVEYPILTPNSLIHGLPNTQIPEIEVHDIDEVEMKKRARYIQTCKNNFWDRWRKEYLTSLRERHITHGKQDDIQLSKGEVVIIKDDDKNRGKWKLGVVEELYKGRDGIIRAARLKVGKNYLERALQNLYPLELSTLNDKESKVEEHNHEESDKITTKPRRSSRTAAANARVKLQLINRDEEENNDVFW